MPIPVIVNQRGTETGNVVTHGTLGQLRYIKTLENPIAEA